MRPLLLLLMLSVLADKTVQAQSLYLGPDVAGIVVAAERRFDPLVQRLIAERSLRALPLLDGKLYYVFPMNAGSTAHMEHLQIRYLESMLDAQAEQAAAEKDAPSDEPIDE